MSGRAIDHLLGWRRDRDPAGGGHCRAPGSTHATRWCRGQGAARERRAVSSHRRSRAGHDVDDQAGHDARLSQPHVCRVLGRVNRAPARHGLVGNCSSGRSGPLRSHLYPGDRGAHADSHGVPRPPGRRRLPVGPVAGCCRRMARTAAIRASAGPPSISPSARNLKMRSEQSQQRLTMATAAGALGVWDWNFEDQRLFVDPGLKSLLGFEDAEISTRPDDWGSRVHPLDVPAAAARCRRASMATRTCTKLNTGCCTRMAAYTGSCRADGGEGRGREAAAHGRHEGGCHRTQARSGAVPSRDRGGARGHDDDRSRGGDRAGQRRGRTALWLRSDGVNLHAGRDAGSRAAR